MGSTPRSFSRTVVSSDCRTGDHGDCAHLSGFGFSLLLPALGARPLLCRCACHADCPVAGRGRQTPETWFDSCTCPGSTGARQHGGRPPSRRQALAENKAYQEAIAEVRANAEGKSRDEIGRLLSDSLQTRGLEPLIAPITEVAIDSITANNLRDRARGGIKAFKIFGKGLHLMSDLLQGQAFGPKQGRDTREYLPDCSKDPARVELDPEAGIIFDSHVNGVPRSLPGTNAASPIGTGDERQIRVWLDIVNSSDESSRIVVGIDGRAIGLLAEAESREFREILDCFFSAGAVVITEGLASLTADGTWELRIWFPVVMADDRGA